LSSRAFVPGCINADPISGECQIGENPTVKAVDAIPVDMFGANFLVQDDDETRKTRFESEHINHRYSSPFPVVL